MQPYKRHINSLDFHYTLKEELRPYWYWDDDDDYDYGYGYYDDPIGVVYEYLNNDGEECDYDIVFQRVRNVTHRPISIRRISQHRKYGLRIDMDSIYSKEMLRQKKIDKILGEEVIFSNTIGEMVKLSYPSNVNLPSFKKDNSK